MNDISHNNWASMSDKSLMETIGSFVKHHRLTQNKSQSVVAEIAGMSRSTLSLLERGETINLSSLIQVLRVLDLLHIMEIFAINNEISPIEYAKLQKHKKQRARSKKETIQPDGDLGW